MTAFTRLYVRGSADAVSDRIVSGSRIGYRVSI
jgi:hypothetical protein